jgi:hypothetical protein
MKLLPLLALATLSGGNLIFAQDRQPAPKQPLGTLDQRPNEKLRARWEKMADQAEGKAREAAADGDNELAELIRREVKAIITRERTEAEAKQRHQGEEAPKTDKKSQPKDHEEGRRPERGQPERGQPDPEARMRHVREAMEHLMQAGLPDAAAQLKPFIQRLENQKQPRSEGGPAKPGPDQILGELQALRRELNELREHVRRSQPQPPVPQANPQPLPPPHQPQPPQTQPPHPPKPHREGEERK